MPWRHFGGAEVYTNGSWCSTRHTASSAERGRLVPTGWLAQGWRSGYRHQESNPGINVHHMQHWCDEWSISTHTHANTHIEFGNKIRTEGTKRSWGRTVWYFLNLFNKFWAFAWCNAHQVLTPRSTSEMKSCVGGARIIDLLNKLSIIKQRRWSKFSCKQKRSVFVHTRDSDVESSFLKYWLGTNLSSGFHTHT
jgi:hypothetical protein